MRRFVFGMCALAVVWTVPVALAAEPQLSIHLVPASEGPCALLEDSLRCEDIVTEGNPKVDQLAYVVLSQFDGMENIKFGIGYDEGVAVTQWIPCYGKFEFPMATWPESGTGTGLAFDTCVYPAGPDSLLILGAFTIEAQSWGRIWVQSYSERESAHIMTCETPPQTLLIRRECALGEARVHGLGRGRSACDPCDD